MKLLTIFLLSLLAAPTLAWADRGMPTCQDCRVTEVRRAERTYYRITGVVRHGNDAKVIFSTPLQLVSALTTLSFSGGYLTTPEGAFSVDVDRFALRTKLSTTRPSVGLVVAVEAPSKPELTTHTIWLPLP